MTLKGALLAITAWAITLALSGCDDMTGTGDEPAALPHHGTWYFEDPDPADDTPLPPDARLVLGAETFTLAMGDGMGTEFTLFDQSGVTRFEVTGTYTIGGDEGVSFTLSDRLEDAVIVEPSTARTAILPAVVAAAEVIRGDTTATLMIDPAILNRVTISGASLPGLLNLPGVTEVTACKGAPCASS